MELTGLSLAQVLAVLGVAGGVVTVLYLLKLRRRRVAVPFVKLWETVLSEQQTTRLLAQLKRWLSLLIALAVVGLLAFALGDPRWAGASDEGRTLAVLVDASASMQATDVEPTRFEQAKSEVRELIDGMGAADRMLIAQMDSSTRPLGPMSGNPRVLREAVGSLEPTDTATDARAAVRMGLDLLRGEPNGEIVVVTDGGIGAADALQRRARRAGVRLSWIRIGERGDNVGITSFSVRRYPLDKTQSEVLVELWNPSKQDRVVELRLLGDGKPVDIQKLTVPAEERVRRFFSNVSGVDRRLETRIRPADGKADVLPADDRAYARVPPRRRARVLAVTDENLYLRAALLLDEYLDVTRVSPASYPAEGNYDVVIFDRFVPSTPPDTNAFYIHPEPAGNVKGPFEIEGTVERPFFDHVDRKHPLVRWTALGNVNIAEALKVRPRRGDEVVARDKGAPLLIAGRRNGHRMAALAFDVRKSDLPLRIAWPLMLLNAIDWFTRETDDYISSYDTGETWHIPVGSDRDEATVEAPDGRARTVPVVDGRAVYSGSRAGFYTVRAGGTKRVFAANLGPSRESRVAPAEQLRVAGMHATSPSAGTPGVRRRIWIYLVAAVLVVLVVEWLTYHRRWTV